MVLAVPAAEAVVIWRPWCLSGDGQDDLETGQSCVDWGKVPERGGHHCVLCTCWCGDLECRHHVVVRVLRSELGLSRSGWVWPRRPSGLRLSGSSQLPASISKSHTQYYVEEGYSELLVEAQPDGQEARLQTAGPCGT
jgi:hypothetical protein